MTVMVGNSFGRICFAFNLSNDTFTRVEFLIDISTFIHIGTICLSLLLGAIISKRKGFFAKGNDYLLLLLGAISIVHLNAGLILSGYDLTHYYIQNLSNAFTLVLGPSIYLAIQHRSGVEVEGRRDLLHFLPFMLYSTIILVGFTGPKAFSFLETIEPLAFLTFVIHIPFYIFVSLRKIKGEENQLFNGLKILLITLLLTYALQLGLIITELATNDLPNYITINSSLLFSFGVIAFAYRCLSNDKVLFESPKYVASSMTKAQAEKIIKHLQELMAKEKPFINPGLKIADVAEQLGITTKSLSQAVNDILDQKFLDYINELRVTYVAELIKDPENANFTLLAVAEMGGFKSPSVFNAAFKKHKGILPSAFRKSLPDQDND